MSVAWVAVGATVLGAGASYMASEDAQDTQQNIANQSAAGQSASLAAQIRQGDELLAFNKEQYADNKARQVGIDAITKQVVDTNLQLSKEAGDRARDSYDFYKTNGRPVVQKTLDEAQNFDSQANIDKARGRATADVNQGFEQADKQSQTALSRMGINPSSGRFLALQQSMRSQKAAALAGAATNAEDQTRNQAINMRQQASNLAQGFPAQTTADGGQSNNSANSANANASAGLNNNLAIGGQALAGMATGAGIYGSAATGYQSAVNGANYQLNNINQQASRDMAGWGNLAGSLMSNFSTPSYVPSGYTGNTMPAGAPMKDGGKVTGPGTGTSDSVPKMLSNGEYVIPAAVVRKKGTQFFDKMLEEEKHTNLGRAA